MLAKFLTYKNLLIGVTALCFFSAQAVAGVVVTGTRVIYPSNAKEVSVRLDNKGKSPVLIQSWIDSGDASATPENIQVPFVLTPPINRVEASKGQTLRLSYTGGPQPADRESVFWLNVLEIPAKPKGKEGENYMQVAFRTRIKLFFRPQGLQGQPEEAVNSVTWTVKGKKIEATNPTPFHVSLVDLTINGKKHDGEMIPPKSTLTLNFSGKAGSKLTGSYVNDYGAINAFEATLK